MKDRKSPAYALSLEIAKRQERYLNVLVCAAEGSLSPKECLRKTLKLENQIAAYRHARYLITGKGLWVLCARCGQRWSRMGGVHCGPCFSYYTGLPYNGKAKLLPEKLRA